MRCDEGYPCEICHTDVTSIVDSDLYLRYVIGRLDPERLHVAPERHLRCNPVLAQYIQDDRFDPVTLDGPFDRRTLDSVQTAEQTKLITRGYRRLHEILTWPDNRDVTEYPLPEVRQRYR